MFVRALLLTAISCALLGCARDSECGRADCRCRSVEQNSAAKYELVTVRQGMKGERSTYRLPALKGTSFEALCRSGLLDRILACPAKIQMELVDPDEDAATSFRGSVVYSALPAEFKSGDLIIIKVANPMVRN